MVDVRYVIFDDENESHIARHGVTPEEVEEVCWSTGRLVKKGRRGTLSVYGRTLDGRYLTVILAPRPRREFYAVTARDMNSPERKAYTTKRRR